MYYRLKPRRSIVLTFVSGIAEEYGRGRAGQRYWLRLRLQEEEEGGEKD